MSFQPKTLLISHPFNGSTQVISSSSIASAAASSLTKTFSAILNLSLNPKKINENLISGFRFLFNGRDIRKTEDLQLWLSSANGVLRVMPRLLGGKGGFGSQMKKEAMSQKKITNWDLSRDLQGRRVRDVNNEKKLVEFIKKQKQEEEMVQKELKNYKEMKKEQGADNFGYHSENNDYRERTEFVEETIANSVSLAFLKNKKKKQLEEDQKLQFQQAEDDATLSKKLKPNSEQDNNPIAESNTSPKNESDQAENNPPLQEQNKEEKLSDAPAPVVPPTLDVKKAIAIGANSDFAPIELNDINAEDDLIKLGDAHLKHELTRLGLKAGGKLEEKAKRLWDIKQDPANLFNPKYMAKKK